MWHAKKYCQKLRQDHTPIIYENYSHKYIEIECVVCFKLIYRNVKMASFYVIYCPLTDHVPCFQDHIHHSTESTFIFILHGFSGTTHPSTELLYNYINETHWFFVNRPKIYQGHFHPKWAILVNITWAVQYSPGKTPNFISMTISVRDVVLSFDILYYDNFRKARF